MMHTYEQADELVQQHHQSASRTPFRVRTITAFLQLSTVPDGWETEVAAAGAFLAAAKQHLEGLGYEVQTIRIATQPFPQFLTGHNTTDTANPNHGSNPDSKQLQHVRQQRETTSAARSSLIVSNALRLEALAAKHGIPLVSIGSSDDPADLAVIPDIIAATAATSCSYALPPEPDVHLFCEVATAIMEIAARTGGMGNFRFASASNVPPGVPYFPVACSGPGLHRSIALGTESDALLYEAFAAAVATAVAAGASDHTAADGSSGVGQRNSSSNSCSSNRQGSNVLLAAEKQLAAALLRHLAPLEAAAKELELLSAALVAVTDAATDPQPDTGVSPVEGRLHQDSNMSATTLTTHSTQQQQMAPSSNELSKLQQPGSGGFTYLGLDTSIAPGLDTPALTSSYELLLQGFDQRLSGVGHGQPGLSNEKPFLGDRQAGVNKQLSGLTKRFGGPGSLSVSALITKVLKGVPLKKTGYCGLMLAVCEDQGLAAAAAAGSISISQLLQYSAVCGCGLDTVPVPGPAIGGTYDHKQQHRPHQQQWQQLQADSSPQTSSVSGSEAALPRVAAEAADACTTASIAALVSDVNMLAFRLQKPLACRLLPLPGKTAGQPTGFNHPYMVNTQVMELDN